MNILLTPLVWVVVALVAVFVIALVLAVVAMLLLSVPLVGVVGLQGVRRSSSGSQTCSEAFRLWGCLAVPLQLQHPQPGGRAGPARC